MAYVSVVTMFLNEESNLPAFREQLDQVLARLDDDFEVVLVDDHSQDGSTAFAKHWACNDQRVQYIRLSRTCGSHSAVAAGLGVCRGVCAVVLASDLQDPPEVIPQLIAKWKQGAQVVWATRRQRLGEPAFRTFSSRVATRILRWLGMRNLPPEGSDLILLDRKVIDAYKGLPEKHTNMVAIMHWLGFRQESIAYIKQPRQWGQSKWTFRRKVRLFIDFVVSFSLAPIRLASMLGICVSLAGLILALVAIANRVSGHPLEGWSSVMVVVLVLGGIQLLMLGVLGEYVGRAFEEARGRPRYIIEERFPEEDRT